MLPYGEAGSKFASELARLFYAFAQASALEAVALKAVAVMQILLLQKHQKRRIISSASTSDCICGMMEILRSYCLKEGQFNRSWGIPKQKLLIRRKDWLDRLLP